MPYDQSTYAGMSGNKSGMKGSGRYKYDKGYGAKYDSKKGMGESNMYMQRGNNYTVIQDGIAKENHKKIKPQMYHNTY